jgi:cytochrome c peroxidase
MKKIVLLSMVVAVTFLGACTKDQVATNYDQKLTEALQAASPSGSPDSYIMPESDDYANLPNQDAKNPVTAAKAELGRLLFFETGLALAPKYPVSKSAYSCSSCHVPSMSFTAGRFQGIADGAVGFGDHGEARVKNPEYGGSEVDAQGARPLPVINLTYVTNALWNGAFGSFGTNAGTENAWGVTDPLTDINNDGIEGLEANNHRALITHRQVINKDVTDSLGYTAMFDAAFPDIPESERYTLQIGANAIAAYFRTILTNRAPFQKWLKGDEVAMTEQQKRGAVLFFTKAGCYNCHNSPSLNAMRFEAIGVNNLFQSSYDVFRTNINDARNLGRGGFTLRQEDLYKFKVPQLYNLKHVGFYFHGASKTSLREVVEYFNAGIPENTTVPANKISSKFKPLGLTTAEVDDLTEFLTNGLYDADITRYAPKATMSGNCFPNNDPQSRRDMGCE